MTTAHATFFGSQLSLLVSSGLINFGGSLLLNVLLARALGAAGLGAWAVACAIMWLIAGSGVVGADWMVLRQGSYYQGVGDVPRLRQTIQFGLWLSGIGLTALAVPVLVFAPSLASRFLGDRSLAIMVQLAALGGPIVGIRQMLLFSSQTFKDVRVIALVSNILQPLSYLVITAAALALVGSTVAAFAAAVIAEAILMVTAAIGLHRRISLGGPKASIDRRELIRFAIPAWGSGVVETVRGNAFALLLGSLSTINNVALLVAAERVAQAATAVNTAMNRIFMPVGSDLYLQNRRDDLVMLVKNIAKWTFSLTLPVPLLMFFFPSQILAVFGQSFQAGEDVMRLVALGVMVLCATGPVTQTLMVIGRASLNVLNYVIVLTIEVASALVLIPRLGATGAALALLAGRVVNNAAPLLEIWRIAGFHPFRRDHWKPVAAGLAAALMAWSGVTLLPVSGMARAAVTMSVLGVIYLISLLLFVFGTDERKATVALLRRRDASVRDGDLSER